jgi:hypothetical protein
LLWIESATGMRRPMVHTLFHVGRLSSICDPYFSLGASPIRRCLQRRSISTRSAGDALIRGGGELGKSAAKAAAVGAGAVS